MRYWLRPTALFNDDTASNQPLGGRRFRTCPLARPSSLQARTQHGIDAAELTARADEPAAETTRKLDRIRSIQAAGQEPTIWVLRYGLNATEYTAVEAAAIDLLMSLPVTPDAPSAGVRIPLAAAEQLTNARREASRGSGITTLEQLVDDLAAPDLTTTTPLLLITLGGWYPEEEPVPGGGTCAGFGFKRAWLDRTLREHDINSLADSTRCWWRINAHRVDSMGIEHAVAVYGGVTRGLFRIEPESWEELTSGRRGFRAAPILAGPLFDESVGPHGRRVPPKARGDQSQFNYWPRP